MTVEEIKCDEVENVRERWRDKVKKQRKNKEKRERKKAT